MCSLEGCTKNCFYAGSKSPKKRKHKDASEARPAKIQHQDGAPNWKQVRADAADIKNRRKAQNKMFEVGKHMKKLWEEVSAIKPLGNFICFLWLCWIFI